MCLHSLSFYEINTGWAVITVSLFENEMREKVTGFFSILFFLTHACSLKKYFDFITLYLKNED
jgi:hypothetical protein